jgi:hypothetical protein
MSSPSTKPVTVYPAVQLRAELAVFSNGAIGPNTCQRNLRSQGCVNFTTRPNLKHNRLKPFQFSTKVTGLSELRHLSYSDRVLNPDMPCK